MEAYLIFDYYEIADYYYGYKSSLITVYNSFDEAKARVDSIVENSRPWQRSFTGENGGPYIEIIKIYFGDDKKEVVYSTQKFE